MLEHFSGRHSSLHKPKNKVVFPLFEYIVSARVISSPGFCDYAEARSEDIGRLNKK